MHFQLLQNDLACRPEVSNSVRVLGLDQGPSCPEPPSSYRKVDPSALLPYCSFDLPRHFFDFYGDMRRHQTFHVGRPKWWTYHWLSATGNVQVHCRVHVCAWHFGQPGVSTEETPVTTQGFTTEENSYSWRCGITWWQTFTEETIGNWDG